MPDAAAGRDPLEGARESGSSAAGPEPGLFRKEPVTGLQERLRAVSDPADRLGQLLVRECGQVSLGHLSHSQGTPASGYPAILQPKGINVARARVGPDLVSLHFSSLLLRKKTGRVTRGDLPGKGVCGVRCDVDASIAGPR
jgi:hypothetical protein